MTSHVMVQRKAADCVTLRMVRPKLTVRRPRIVKRSARTIRSGFREFQRRSLWLVSVGLAILFIGYAQRLIILAFAGCLLAILLRTVADLIVKDMRLAPRLS
jgi:predicted PurR-regulated permease PerM